MSSGMPDASMSLVEELSIVLDEFMRGMCVIRSLKVKHKGHEIYTGSGF